MSGRHVIGAIIYAYIIHAIYKRILLLYTLIVLLYTCIYCYIRVYCCYIRVNIHVNTLNEFWGIYALLYVYIYALLYVYIRVTLRVYIRVTLFVYNVTFAKGVNHLNPIKTALVTKFGSIKGT